MLTFVHIGFVFLKTYFIVFDNIKIIFVKKNDFSLSPSSLLYIIRIVWKIQSTKNI